MTLGPAERFVLLDRDGVLNVDLPVDAYVTDAGMLELLPGAAAGVAALNQAGFEVVLCSNQQCVGKGLVSGAKLDGIFNALGAKVTAESGGRIRGFLYCPHLAAEGCACRKPEPGLLLEARDRYGFDLEQTFFVGDAYSDLEAARRAGCRSILVLTGNDGPRYRAGDLPDHPADYAAQDLPDAVEFIVRQSGQRLA